jgi:hypothetical protein
MPVHSQVLFIQGGGERVHDAWDAKLIDSLTGELGRATVTAPPRMQDPAAGSTRNGLLAASATDGLARGQMPASALPAPRCRCVFNLIGIRGV